MSNKEKYRININKKKEKMLVKYNPKKKKQKHPKKRISHLHKKRV